MMNFNSRRELTHLSLFSGIGGLDIAAEWAGFTTVGQCEWADFPVKVLEKHWPDVPKWRDVHEFTGEDFRTRTGLRTVDVISGGFPCQPFSVAGKQKGKDDERYLFPEMLRVIAELKPHFVVGENVPGILRIAAADVVESLEREGYQCVLFDFEAAAVGAHHRRERIAFVAHKQSRVMEDTGCCGCGGTGILLQQPRGTEFECTGEIVADTYSQRLQGCEQHEAPYESDRTTEKFTPESTAECGEIICNIDKSMRGRIDWGMQSSGSTERRRWPAEPDVGRVANGVPDRVDRIKALGNAVVPKQFYPIFKAIAEELRRYGS